MKKTHLLSLTCMMIISSPIFSKAPLQLFVAGEKTNQVDLNTPLLEIESELKQSKDSIKMIVENESINDKQIGSLISFLNNNKHLVIKGKDKSDIGKLYFNPDFGSNQVGKVFMSNGSGAIRLQQAFYFRDDQNKTNYVPFEGAEAVVFIKKEISEDKPAAGHIESINSSLINSKEYEVLIPRLKSLSDESFQALRKLSPEKREEFINVILGDNSIVNPWSNIARAVYPDKRVKSKEAFVSLVKSDDNFVQKFLLALKGGAKLVFSSNDELESYDLVYSVNAPFGIPINLKINTDVDSDSVFHSVSSLSKHVTVNIYRGSMFKLKKSKKRSAESEKAKDMKIDRGLFRQEDYDLALINLSKVVEEFKSNFNWNGFDNKGSDLDATVRYKGSKILGTDFLRQNAAWLGSPYNQFIFGRGGDDLDGFLEAFDVIGHEYCHAVVGHTANLNNGGEPGALNEHVCDILGVGVESTINNKPYDFIIGELVVQNSNKGLRDFLNPEKSASQQAISMDQVNTIFGPNCVPSEENDACGVHFSNGVTNKAIAEAITVIGWDKMKDVVFNTVTKRLRSSSNFLDYKRQIVASCLDDGRIADRDCMKIEGYFKRLGVSEPGQ